MTKKKKADRNMDILLRSLNAMGGRLSYRNARQAFGSKLLKKARRDGFVEMDPDPHTGRQEKRVGQKIKKRLPGWMKPGKEGEERVRTDIVTNYRYSATPTPVTVTLTEAGKARAGKGKGEKK